MCRLRRLVAAFSLAALPIAGAAAEPVTLPFLPQTGFIDVRFADAGRDTLALAGRDDDGRPRLALLTFEDGAARVTERALPNDAVAIDAGPGANGGDALYVLAADRVLRIAAPDAPLEPVARADSLYRGRSFAPVTASVDLARDLDGDGDPELVLQGFDQLTVLDGDNFERRFELALPAIRRSFERAQNYRPVRVAPSVVDGVTALVAVRGDDLLRFPLREHGTVEPDVVPLSFGLSSERDIERFYNGDAELDQRDVTLREPELLVDLNGDDLPDLVTLETRSEGVFDKQTTYRVHLARGDGGYDAEPDSEISSKGYQFYLSTEQLEPGRVALVTPGVRIGVRASIGALFSRSVTLDIAIHAADDAGVIPTKPSEEVRAKVRFDFGSGQVEFPTEAFGDLDGDGRRDLILKRGRDRLGWRRNLGGGRFDRDDERLELPAPKNGATVYAADLDGDGTDEVIVRYDMQDGEDFRRQLRVVSP